MIWKDVLPTFLPYFQVVVNFYNSGKGLGTCCIVHNRAFGSQPVYEIPCFWLWEPTWQELKVESTESGICFTKVAIEKEDEANIHLCFCAIWYFVILSFIHLVSLQIFNEHLLYARHWELEQKDNIPAPGELIFQWKRQAANNKTITRIVYF